MSDPEIAALVERGVAQQRAGQHKLALQFFQQALQRGGASVALWCRIGECWEQLKDFQRADGAYVAAIELDPTASEPYLKASELARRTSLLAARVGQAATARELSHAAYQYLYSLGARQVHRGEWHEAEAAFLKARAIEPANWSVHVDLGQCLYRTARHRAAEESIREGLRLAPRQAMAHYHLGIVLLRQGRPSEAEEPLRAAVTLDPALAQARTALAEAIRLQGRVEEAETLYRAAAAADPEAERGLYLSGPVYEEAGADEIHRRHRAWGERVVAAARPSADEAAPFANARDPGRRLRVGYLSPDFKTHSVAYFIEPLLACHDRDTVEPVCYAEVASPDATTERLKALAGLWRPTTRLDDAALRRQIREDGIDILIDLAGHTDGNRLRALAIRPAPVVASWLGYPTTTGLATVDWRITDAVADPPGAEAQHVERLLRLDGGFLCFRPPEEAPDVAPLPAAAAGRVTFGSFNNLLKVTPAVVAAWAALLRAVPGSRLLLKALLLRDPAAQKRLHGLFAAHGIPAERVELRGGTNDQASHLAMYGEVDLALDTFPYNGTATTCEALWMGVPVVTLAGDRHAARVGRSLLHRVGLDELVHADVAGYVACAARLAGDLPGLAARRAGLRRQVAGSALCDGPGFARAFEAGLRRMWAGWCAGSQAIRA